MKMPIVHWVALLAVTAIAFAIGFSGGAIEPKLPDGDTSGERVEMPSPQATSEPSDAVAESPREVLLRATSYPSELRRTHALLEWIRGLRPEKYADAAAIALSLPPERAKEALRLLYAAWAEYDLRAAVEDSRTRQNVPYEISEHVLKEWGRRDLAATLEWLIETQNPEERIGAFFGLEEDLLDLARENPTAMYQLLARPEIARGIRNMREIIGVLAERDPAGAARQAQALPSRQ